MRTALMFIAFAILAHTGEELTDEALNIWSWIFAIAIIMDILDFLKNFFKKG